MIKYLIRAFLVSILLVPNFGKSNVLVVDDLGDPTPFTGTQTLRQAITLATDGDTIFIDVSGTIYLQSVLTVSKSITIIGGTASHLTIDINSWDFQLASATPKTSNIHNLRIINGPCPCGNTPVAVGSSMIARFHNVLFEGIGSPSTSMSGGAIRVTGASGAAIECFNCSFINFSSGLDGGAVLLSSNGVSKFVNCTFTGCVAGSKGGAIYVSSGNAELMNNTFTANTSTSNIGHAIASASSMGLVLQNNIITDPSAPKANNLLSNTGTIWASPGGNIFSGSAAALSSVIGVHATDRAGEAFSNIQLRSTLITDGYGLKYFTIVSQTSVAIDNGVVSASLPITDQRRAPRILYGDTGPTPDAGACEYTPYRVTSTGGAGSFTNVWTNMNLLGGNGAPEYMEFDLPGPTTINLGSTQSYTGNGDPRIIDGYTQHGSKVAGPRDPAAAGTYIVPAFLPTVLQSSGTILDIDLWVSGSQISGLKFDNGGGSAISIVDDCDIRIFGNHFISVPGTGTNGIYASGSSSGTIAQIGGPQYFEMNVLSNYNVAGTSAAILLANNTTGVIRGNLIGTTIDGLNSQKNYNGIVVGSGATAYIGGYSNRIDRNVISNNTENQIWVHSGATANITGNIIGPNISKNIVSATGACGVKFEINSYGYVGSPVLKTGNIIGGQGYGIDINSGNGIQIFQNHIGISPDPVAMFPLIPNGTAISILNNGDAPILVGTSSLNGRNYICGSSTMGIYIQDGNGHIVEGNFIGIKPDNTPAGNNQFGIHVVNSFGGNQLKNNVITDHSTDGISINSGSGGDIIQNNKIGTDTLGTTSFGNQRGISLFNLTGSVSILNNLVSGNATDGIFIDNSGFNLSNNIIGLDFTATAPMPNTNIGVDVINSTGGTVLNNIISANGNVGLFLGASSNVFVRANKIGTNTTGLPFGNGSHGIAVFFTSSFNTIGGTIPSDYNTIAFNGGAGIDIERESSSIGILGNHFKQNFAHGITLNAAVGASIPLANDLNDPDISGPAGPNVGNNGQNYPILNSANKCSAITTITGTVNVDGPTSNYLIQVYKVLPGNIDASGHGEGDTLVASGTYNAGGSNTFPFNFILPNAVLNDVYVATCSKESGTSYHSSEFSDTILVKGGFSTTITGFTNVTCNGFSNGSATVSSTAVVAPITYQWYDATTNSPIAGANAVTYSGFGPGIYTCTVTDGGGCSITSDTVTIVEPPVLSSTPSSTNATCFGVCDGTITIIESGGTGGYQYSIDNGSSFFASSFFSALCAGSYQCVVMDANGCTSTPVVVTITSPSAISVSPTVVNETCSGLNNGSVTLTAVGGVGGFQYSIDNGSTFFASNSFTALAPNTYNYVVVDANGCTASGLITVGPGTTITPNFNFTSTTGCQNTFDFDFTDVSTSGPGTITSWNWTFPSASPSSATIQNVSGVMFFTSGVNNVELTVITSDGCTDSITIPVSVLPTPFVNAGPDTSICLGDAFTHVASVSGGTPGFIYNWQPAGDFVSSAIEDAQVTTAFVNTIGLFQHILTVTDVNGCFGRDTVLIDVQSLPTVLAGADFPTCNGTAVTLSGSGTASSYTWDNAVIDGSPFIATTTTTYTVTGVNANGCTATDAITITVDNPYTVNAGIDFTVCETAATISLTGTTSAPTFNWVAINGTGIFTAPTSTVTAYDLSAADSTQSQLLFSFNTPISGTCPAQADTIVVTLDNSPFVDAGNVSPSNCNTGNVPLNANGYNSSSFTWSTTGSGSFSSVNSFTSDYIPGVGETGTITAYLTSASNGSCPAVYDSVLINLVAGPTASIGNDTMICRTGVPFISMNGIITNASGFNWYTSGSGSWVGAGSLTPDYYFSGADASSASINLILEATSVGCPPAYDTMLIVFTDPHSAFAGIDQVICSGNTVALNGSITGSPSATWFGGGAFSPNSSTLTGVTYTPTAADISIGFASIVLVTDTSGACPLAKDTILITINTSPVANAGADDTICAGTTFTLDASGSSGTITSYTWNELPAIFVSNSITTPVSPTATTSYEILVDNGTCSDRDTVTITVSPGPDASFNYSTTAFCTSDIDPVATVATSGGSFTTSSGGIILNSTTGTIDVSASAAGTYTIYYTITSPCTAVDSVSINIFAPPAVTITPDHTACLGDTVTFTATPLGGTWSGPSVNALGEMITLSAGIGIHTVQYSYFDSGTGCTVLDTNNIFIHPLPAVNFTGLLGPYCPSDGPVVLTGTPSGGAFFLNGTFQSMSTFSYDPTTPGLDTIYYVYNDPVTGCYNFDGQGAVVTSAPPTPILSPSAPYTFCSTTPTTLTVTNPGTVVNWYADAGLTSLITTGSTILSTSLPGGNATIYVVNSNGGTCGSSPLLVTYTNFDASLIYTGGPYETCEGQPVQLQLSLPSGPVYFAWNNDPTMNDTASLTPIVNPTVTTTYIVNVFDSFSMCTITDSAVVTIVPCSLDEVTNAFTPNGDGVNDTWIIDGIQAHPQNRVMIFNRWGDKLIQFEGYDNLTTVWDGKYKGATVAAGTYYFIIEYFDVDQQKAGWIQVNY